MKTPIVTAATALASCLILAAGAAYAAPSINLNPMAGVSASPVELVKKGGGGGGGGRYGGGAALKGGGGGRNAHKGGRGDKGHYAHKGGKGDKGHYAHRDGKGRYAHKGGKSDFKHRHYGRYFRYYPGIFAYGAYSYYDECDWLWRKARITGSPYWWRRYEECRYYD